MYHLVSIIHNSLPSTRSWNWPNSLIYKHDQSSCPVVHLSLILLQHTSEEQRGPGRLCSNLWPDVSGFHRRPHLWSNLKQKLVLEIEELYRDIDRDNFFASVAGTTLRDHHIGGRICNTSASRGRSAFSIRNSALQLAGPKHLSRAYNIWLVTEIGIFD